MTESQEWRKMLKKYYLCHDCKQQDAFTLAGRSLCAECAEKAKERSRAYRAIPENREKMYATMKEKRDKRRESGKCTSCGRTLEGGKHKTCVYCHAKQKKRNERSLRKRGIMPRTEGICWQCNKNPWMDGHKLCADCYAKKVPIILKNREKSLKEHPWKNGW